jgi:hypothetical protein
MLTELASAAADENHQSRSGMDPPRRMTADEQATRLAIVRRAVAAVEALPDPNDHRPSLAAALSQLGAFDEALQVARRMDHLHSPLPPQSRLIPGGAPAEAEGEPATRDVEDPKVKHQAEAIFLLALIHARAGDWASAARTFATTSAEDSQQRLGAVLIASYRARSGDVAGTLTWARSLPSSSLRAWALRGLAAGISGDDGLE